MEPIETTYAEAGGARIPVLGFGTWQLEGEACREGVAHALELGYRHIDTAQAYGNEAEVGAALKASGLPREHVWLTTKLWTVDGAGADELVASLDASLERLDTPWVDLVLIHWPPPEKPLEEAIAALERVRADERVRHTGVSNFTPDMWRETLARVPAITNQVEYHPYLAQDALLALARDEHLVLTAYSPLAQGRTVEDEALAEIGRTHGKSAGQVALRWLIQQGVVAIPRSSSAEHRATNADVFDFHLGEEEMARVHGLARGERLIDPSFAPAW